MDVLKWFRENGGYCHEKLSVEYTSAKGFHLLGSFKPRELIIDVPADLLVNVNSLKTATDSHAALAEYLYTTKNVWTESIERANLPIFWEDQGNLSGVPPPYNAKLAQQKNQVRRSFEESGLQDFERWQWAWGAVNSRCLYWDVGRDREQQMTLAPLVDYFNHSTNQDKCVQISRKLGRMQVRAPAEPRADGELNLFYGPHENAFLLLEYGFVPSENKYDFIDITEDIEKLPIDRAQLAQHDFLGAYTLSVEGPCFRTVVALCSIDRKVARIVQGLDDPPSVDHHLGPLLLQVRARFEREPREALKALYSGYLEILNANVHK